LKDDLKAKESAPWKYDTGLKEADALIEKLTDMCVQPEDRELLREIMTTAIKLGLEKTDHGDLKLINSALKELRYSLKIFAPYRRIRKVTVFGSARSKDDSPEYRMSEEFSKKIVEKGYLVITGAGPGVMEAGNKGAGPGKSFGVNIKLPFEQRANPYISSDESKLINFKYFFTRKLIFVKESHATVLLPGGFGTNDEFFEVVTLFQTGKTLPRPIIMLEPKEYNYWERCLAYVKKSMLEHGFISKENLKFFTFTKSVDKAVDEIVRFYRNYHSLRYVGDLTSLRLNRTLSETKLNDLNRDFQDILVNGGIEQRGALEEEVRNNDYPELPRIVMRFDKRSFGRLKEMIDAINGD
jgi:uncharacterized protein (TIGR00730 family)